MTHKAVLGAGSSQLARERVRIQQSQQTSPTQGPQTPKAVDVFLASDAAKDVAADVVAGALAGRFDAIPWIPKIDFAGLSHLRGRALLQAITAAVGRPTIFGYANSREFMFRKLDVKVGHVTCVYGGKVICVRAGYRAHMSPEHTWPQSNMNGQPGAKADLHHLFPAAHSENRQRSSINFGQVVTVRKTTRAGAKYGLDAFGTTVFEPPKGHKGNVARAMLYMVAFYGASLSEKQAKLFRQWNREDPVDHDEMRRTLEIAKVQGMPNPFVLREDFADKAFAGLEHRTSPHC